MVTDGSFPQNPFHRFTCWIGDRSSIFFAAWGTLNPPGHKKVIFAVWGHTGLEWMAIGWSVVRSLVGILVAGSTRGDYLGADCLLWPGQMRAWTGCYRGWVRFDYADIRTHSVVAVWYLPLNFDQATFLPPCTDFAGAGTRGLDDSCCVPSRFS